MLGHGRNEVFCVGGDPPTSLLEVVRARQLTTAQLDADAFDPKKHNPYAVFIVTTPATGGRVRGWLRQLLCPVVDCGGLLAVIAGPDPASFAEAATAVAEFERELGVRVPNVRVRKSDLKDIAGWFAEHEPGEVPNWQLDIRGLTGSEREDHEALLRRAFHGYSRIVLSEEEGGRSPGCIVWRVEASKGSVEEGVFEDFIVKAGPRKELLVEFQTSRDMAEVIPFPFRAPVVESRYMEGVTRAILVSMFVGRARRFDHYLRMIDSPELAVTALFDGPLRNWRRSAHEPDRQQLGKMYVDERSSADAAASQGRETGGRPLRPLLPRQDRLDKAYRIAQDAFGPLPAPADLWTMMLSMAPVQYQTCRMHGDLNARNLFVRWNGVDVILIDFSHAGDVGPMSRDPSRLEVSIAFDVADSGKNYLPNDVLLKMYKSPLLPPWRTPSKHDGRREAVRQIRCHICGEGVRNEEYEITTACHLLNFARERPNLVPNKETPRLQATSYCLAARLIEGRRNGSRGA